MRILFLALVFVLAGCGKGSAVDLLTHENDAELGKLYDEFLAVGKAQGKDVSNVAVTVTSGRVRRDTGETAAGVCEQDSDIPLVAVDTETWKTLSDVQKRGVVFHELGHCVLKRGHRDDKMSERGCPVSIMSTDLPIQSCMMLHEDAYNTELFSTI